MIRILLTLDLIQSENERTEFYAFLRNKVWEKTKDVETVWTVTFGKLDPNSEDSLKRAKSTINNTLLEAAKKLKLNEISYIMQIGNNTPISRAIKKKDGQYKCFIRELYPLKQNKQ